MNTATLTLDGGQKSLAGRTLENNGTATLSENARFAIYRSFMRLQRKLDLQVFAIVVNKARVAERFENRRAASEVAWEYLLQRLERRATPWHVSQRTG